MKRKVLIFDDDADILEVCAIVLESYGFETAKENSCQHIVDKLDRHTPDVLLMDNKIPPEGGISACRTLRSSEKYAQLPIIFFSANKDVSKLAEEAGADLYIEKPFDVDALVTIVKKALSLDKT